MSRLLIVTLILTIILFCCKKESNDKINSNVIEKPDSTNTGLTDTSVLIYSDALTISSDNQTVENLNIHGELSIDASNVTVRNCRIWGGIYWCVEIRSGVGITIENCEIGRSIETWPAAVKGIEIIKDFSNVEVTIRNNYIRYIEDGIFIGNQNDTIEHSVIIDNNCITHIHGKDPDSDSLTIHARKGDGIEILGNISSLLIQNNSIEVPSTQTSSILLETNWAAIKNVVLENNWLDGGGYTLYTRERNFDFTGLIITNNKFGRNYNYGYWSTDITPDFLDGNTWEDTGEAIPDMN